MKKKLLFVLPSLRSGGAEKSLVTLLRVLDETKYDIDLFLFRREGLFLPLVPDYVHVLDGGTDYCMFDGSMKSAVLYFLRHGKLRKAISRILYGRAQSLPAEKRIAKSWKYLSRVLPKLPNAYDASVGYLEGTATYFALRHVRAKKYFSFLHTDYDRIREQTEMDAPFYAKLDKLIGVSDLCCERAENVFPFLRGRTLTIRNIISPELIGEMAEEAAELPHEADETVLLTVGRLSPPKGIDIAVEACAALCARGHAVKWYHIGIGELQGEIEEKIKALQMQDRFILLGERSNPYSFMRLCDIYVQPSRFEGKSIAIDEAKCLAKPIVVTDFGTVRDQITDGVNGIVAQKTPESIADAVELLLLSPEKREALSAALRAEKVGNAEEAEKFCALL